MVLKGKQIVKKTTFIINNKKCDNDLQIANEFKQYFVSVGQTLAAKLPPASLNPINFLQPNPHSLVFTHIEEIEVATLINSLNNSSPGYDGIPSTLVKRTMHLYLKTLTLIINQAFYDRVLPRELKIAKVIQIYKSGSTMELNNYRLISVLNIFSKVFERLMYDRLTQFLDKYNILYHNQFGIRQYHSTHHALITLVDKVTK